MHSTRTDSSLRRLGTGREHEDLVEILREHTNKALGKPDSFRRRERVTVHQSAGLLPADFDMVRM